MTVQISVYSSEDDVKVGTPSGKQIVVFEHDTVPFLPAPYFVLGRIAANEVMGERQAAVEDFGGPGFFQSVDDPVEVGRSRIVLPVVKRADARIHPNGLMADEHAVAERSGRKLLRRPVGARP